jgi:two-component system phosphate regulon sensor histidine kinase PhoR
MIVIAAVALMSADAAVPPPGTWVLVAIAGTLASVGLIWQSRKRAAGRLQQLLSRFGPEHGSIFPSSPEQLALELSDRIDQVLTETARMESERERLAAILSSMTEGVIAIDREERILLANEASYAAMDSDPETPVGRPLRELVRNVQIHDYVRTILNGESQEPIECEVTRTNRIVTVKADVIGPNAPKGAVLTIHDISELRRLERIRREFVANVSHELKTPLTVIQACADTLAEGALDDPVAAQKFLGRIDEQSSRLAELINDMLDLGRIEASNEVLELEPVDPEQIIRECASQREGIAAANQISLTIELSTEQFFVDTDATSLRTLVGNLTDNAIKYTPAGGSVTLELDRTADEAIIRVRDTGIGIEREHINRIFQRFYRVDSARSRASGGSGLGLAICKHLAQQLNGEIDVESVPGTGSTFTLRLPLAGAES